EVLLLFDRVDEWLVSSLTEFDGKPLKSIAKGELDLGDLEDEGEKKEQKKIAKEFKDLVKRVKKALGDRVKEVRLTHRLTDSPACLVSDLYDMGTHLERILKEAGQEVPSSKPILELNPEHPLVLKLREEKPGKRFDDWVEVLFDQALLAEGGQLDDPATFVARLNALLLELGKEG
ncbi:MAG TPA: molecular chaperone HtpG, partial [Gammaproteobacteria bacterium]|nr:molecular chaperone HtpG [Gammaproteobacteria bacterium]